MITFPTINSMKSGFFATLFSFLLVLASHAQVVFSLNKTSYVTGEAITATWSGRTSPAVRDWIGIYRNPNPGGNPDGNPASTIYRYTSSGTQTPASPALSAGSITFNNPGLAVGNWTAYFLANDGYTILGSVNFTIGSPPVFSLNKTVYQVGEAITATWSGRVAPTTTDWIGIYPRNLSGVPDGSPGSTIWNYTNGTQTAGSALAAGSITFTNPGLPRGDWTAYFLAADGYQILGTFQFTVANSPRIIGFTADHAFINDGTPITLSWVVDPGDGSVQTLTVSDGTNVSNVVGLDVLEVSPQQNTTFTLTLNGTVTAQARVFRDGGNSNAFSIGAIHLTTGGQFNATWNGTSGNSNSWVGIYRAGDVPGPVAATYWNYLNGTKTAGGAIRPNGTLGFTPTKGDYYAVLFTDSGYTIEQGPIRFSVIDEQIKSFAVSNFGQDGGDMRLDWNSLPGEIYDVLSSTNLTDWQNEVENIRASSTSSSVFMAPTPADPQRFFRVRQRAKVAP